MSSLEEAFAPLASFGAMQRPAMATSPAAPKTISPATIPCQATNCNRLPSEHHSVRHKYVAPDCAACGIALDKHHIVNHLFVPRQGLLSQLRQPTIAATSPAALHSDLPCQSCGRSAAEHARLYHRFVPVATVPNLAMGAFQK